MAIRQRLCRVVVASALLACLGCGGGQARGSTAAPEAAATPTSRLFGSHNFSYAAGTILPSHVTQAQRDDATRTAYDRWKSTYLRQGCGDSRYYVWSQGVALDDAIAVSEGMGYGMMTSVYMAGHDPAARTMFDGLYRFVQDHPADTSANLMAWVQVADCSTPPDEAGPASDGDIDIAFALALAHRQWGSDGAINYLSEARNRMAAVLAREIHPTSLYVHIGDPELFPTHADGTRPSDFIADHFRTFGSTSGDGNWTRVVDRAYSILQTVRHGETGLVPDLVVEADESPQPAPPEWLESEFDGDYYYNACRVPWRIGTDYVVSGDARALAILSLINTWVRATTGDDPEQVNNGYLLDGVGAVKAEGRGAGHGLLNSSRGKRSWFGAAVPGGGGARDRRDLPMPRARAEPK